MDTILWGKSSPQPGDIVLFNSPADGTRLIKRVVAVGGQTVELIEGTLIVDGDSLVSENSTFNPIEHLGGKEVRLDLGDGPGPDISPLLIPHGKVLVLGDHRGKSADSRYFGLVDEKDFFGKAIAIYWRSGYGLSWERI